MIKMWFSIILMVLIVSNYTKFRQLEDLSAKVNVANIKTDEKIENIADCIPFQVGINEDGSIKEVFYDETKNLMQAINKEGKLRIFDLNEAGFRITGYGLGQNWYTISLANNNINQTFIKIQIGNVIDRWTKDENKACWGVKEIYIYFDGSEFNVSDQAEYVSYIDREENSWVEQVMINQVPCDLLELPNKYITREDTTYFIQ